MILSGRGWKTRKWKWMAVGGNLVTSVDLRQFKSQSLQMIWLIRAQQMCFRNVHRRIHLWINLQQSLSEGPWFYSRWSSTYTYTPCPVLYQSTFSQPITIHFHLWPFYVPVLFLCQGFGVHLFQKLYKRNSVILLCPETRLKVWVLSKRLLWIFIRDISHFINLVHSVCKLSTVGWN